MSSKFPFLSFVSLILRGMGWLLFVFGIYGTLMGIDGLDLPAGYSAERLKAMYMLISGISALWFGLVAVAIGELIGVLFAIEANTRAAAFATESIQDNQRKD